MTSTDDYDVIIIGSGAGGGTLAGHLAPSGRKVLIIERGGWLPREIENWDAGEVFVKNRYVSADTWFDDKGKGFQPGIHYYVGGQTKFYGAALYRLRREDFGELRHHDGVSPAWPITYDEFEPYYTRAERMYEVHGARGEDPTEPKASAPYPFPAVSHEPRIQQLSDDLVRAGYHPFHAPCGVRLLEGDMPNSPCIRCATCDGFPSLVQAKSDAEIFGVRPALKHPNVTLLINARVTKLTTDAAGTSVTGVEAEVDGAVRTYRGDIVVVSAGAANSAKLLLASANDRHPNGLANGSDQVGRNYMFHNSTAVLAVSKEPNPTKFQKTLGINDFYFGMKDFPYPMGNIQMVGKSSAPMFRGEKPLETKLAPTFSLDEVAKHAVDFWLSTEDLGRPENRVTLAKDGSITLSYTPNNQEPKQRLYNQLKSMLGHLGMHPDHLIPRTTYLKNEIPIAGVAHQAGTVRFGTDPATSALDPYCKAHELDNLYVVDTSFFPSIGAVNPALTAIANAIRVGDHLLDRLGVAAADAHEPEAIGSAAHH
ncbi:MAG TPA: GMC family oxidoreductase [Candidatus Limnocylindrales bacterium]